MKIKQTYLIGAYLCLMALMLLAKGELAWLSDLSQWIALPILSIFFFANTGIDTRFEKNIFYGILLFSLSSLLPLAKPVLGAYVLYLILAIWMIAYLSYSRALISITSGSSTVLYKQKWLAILTLISGLAAIYFIMRSNGYAFSGMIPWLCFGLASLLYLLASLNLYGQLLSLRYALYLTGAALLLGFNTLLIKDAIPGIGIFDHEATILFYIGQLFFIFVAVKSSMNFKSDDFTDIASVLKKK